MDSDNYSSSASDTERGSDTDDDGSDMSRAAGGDAAMRHRGIYSPGYGRSDGGRSNRRRSLNVSRADVSGFVTRRSDMDATDDETLWGGGGFDGSGSGRGGGGGGVAALRAPHWTESESHTHDRHVMQRASDNHENLWQAVADIQSHKLSGIDRELACKKGDVVVVTEEVWFYETGLKCVFWAFFLCAFEY